MNRWEFLLQREGDRAWLSLEAPDVEILEGRYRVMVRSPQKSSPLEVRVVHLDKDVQPPVRRIKKRTSKTNADGLMVVIPFTNLRPGLWELSCTSTDLMSEFLGQACSGIARLQVLAYAAEECAGEESPMLETAQGWLDVAVENDGFPEPLWQAEGAIANSTDAFCVEATVGAEEEGWHDVLQRTEAFSSQIVETLLQQLDLDTLVAPLKPVPEVVQATPVVMEAIAPEPSDAEPLANDSAPEADLFHPDALRLTLAHVALVAQADQTVRVAGTVRLALPGEVKPGVDVAFFPDWLGGGAVLQPALADRWAGVAVVQLSQIQLEVRDPQSRRVLVTEVRSMQGRSLPQSFGFAVQLPADLATHLLIGEVHLWACLPNQPETRAVLCTETFTVTVNPDRLIAEMTKVGIALSEPEHIEEVDSPALRASIANLRPPSLDLSFLQLGDVQTTESTPVQFESSSFILPPQIYHPPISPLGQRQISLPQFAEPQQPNSQTTEVLMPEEGDISTDAAEVSLPLQELPPEALIFTLDEAEASAILAEALDAPPTTESSEAESPLNVELSPTQVAFQALNLRDRFLHRLTALASDTELRVCLGASLPKMTALGAIASSPAESDLWAKEVVVLDSEPTAVSVLATARQVPTAAAVNPLVLPIDQPVPTPTLQLTSEELVTGAPINLRVCLPNLLPRIYVKLWVNDRQTRTLLDGPRWLVDFLPNAQDQLEALTQLTVPFGSIAIRIEAIAVEMQTQRESHKVVLERTIASSEVINLSLEEFSF